MSSWKNTIGLMVFAALFFLFPGGVHAASRYWVGTGSGAWNVPANWASADPASCTGGGASVPGSSDVAYFDADCDNDASMNVDVNVIGINIASGYSGTVSPSSSVSITVGTTGFVQDGGTFTSTEGTLTLSGNFTKSGGIFNEGTGTITFAGGYTTFNVDSQETLYNVRLNKSGGSFITYITDNDTMIITGTLTLDNGYFASSGTNYLGTINLQGNAIQNSTADTSVGFYLRVDFGNNDVSQTYTINGGYGPVLFFDSASDANDSVVLNASGTLDGLHIEAAFGDHPVPMNYNGNGAGPYNLTLERGYYYQEAGTFTAPAILTLNSGGFTKSGGTFDEGTGTVVFGGGAIDRYNVDSSETFYNLTLNMTGNTYSIYFPENGDKAVITGTLSLTNGTTSNGTFEVQGNVTVASTFDSGTTPLVFSGSNNQIFDLTGATGLFDADITVNKSGGVVTLASALVMNVSNQDLTIQSGTLDLNGNDLTVDNSSNNGKLNVNRGGNLQLMGSETITAESGYPRINSGSTVTYDGTAGPYTLKDHYTYRNLTMSGAATTFNMSGALALSGSLTINAGTLDATADNFNITLSGAWINKGTFTARSGTVTLDGLHQTLSGSTTFNHLTKVEGGDDSVDEILTVAAGTTQTVAGTLTLDGRDDNDRINLVSSLPGTRWNLVGTSYAIDFVDVTDSNAASLVTHTNTVDGGNNLNWGFDESPPVPSGFSPASASTITDTTQTITFTTDENATCKVSLSDQAYGDMSTNCSGSGTTSQSCTTTDLSPDGAKTVYIACTDGTNADTADTNEALSYTLDTSGPTVLSANSDKTDGSYKEGTIIDIDLTFSEAVTTTGSGTITLETGDTDRTCTFVVSNATAATCNYTVQAGDTSSDLTVSSVTGTIKDAVLNPMISPATPTTNLAANKNLLIDTTAPAAPGIPDLAAASDTGESPTDDVTKDTTPSFTVSCETSATVTLFSGSTALGSGTCAGGTVTVISSVLTTNGDYSVQAKQQDVAGNYSATGSALTFALDTVSPTVSALSPADDATGIATTANLVMTFNEVTGKTGTGYVTIYKSSDDSIVEQINTATGAVTGSGTVTVTINPTATFANSTAYYMKIDANAFPDAAGNFFTGIGDSTTWNFMTEAAASIPTVETPVSTPTHSGGGRGKDRKPPIVIFPKLPVVTFSSPPSPPMFPLQLRVCERIARRFSDSRILGRINRRLQKRFGWECG